MTKFEARLAQIFRTVLWTIVQQHSCVNKKQLTNAVSWNEHWSVVSEIYRLNAAIGKIHIEDLQDEKMRTFWHKCRNQCDKSDLSRCVHKIVPAFNWHRRLESNYDRLKRKLSTKMFTQQSMNKEYESKTIDLHRKWNRNGGLIAE